MGSGQRGLAPDPHTLPNWLHELEQWSKLCTLKLPDLGNGIRTHMYTPGFCKEESEVKVIQLGPTLSNPMDCSTPVSSVYGISQIGIAEWIAISFSRGSA